jgi:hypothetical protein
LKIIPFLEILTDVDDVRPILRKSSHEGQFNFKLALKLTRQTLNGYQVEDPALMQRDEEE